jgi:hypothetical protein
MTDVSPRLAPLLAQLDTSLAMALDRMQGLSDDEFRWSPAPDAATIAPDGRGRLRPVRPPDDKPRTRTIAWLIGHLGEMALLRADYTDGAALESLPDHELDLVGRSDFPWGLDRELPILDIVWWMNRELIHHTAEVAFVRDLYTTRS